MNPLVKRLVTALALKEAWDRIQEMRQPKKPSVWARLGKFTLLAGAGGSLLYLFKSGKIPGLKGSSSGSTSTWSYDEDRLAGEGSLGRSGAATTATTPAEPGATTASASRSSTSRSGAPSSPASGTAPGQSRSKTEETVGSDK